MGFVIIALNTNEGRYMVNRMGRKFTIRLQQATGTTALRQLAS